jgi:hypothetical protein
MIKKTWLGNNELKTFIAIILGVLLLWTGTWWAIDTFLDTTASTNAAEIRGQFGDKFGAVNSLFSGFAFAGIILTILLQRGELIETRTAISQERFDTTFFELLALHMNITERVETRGGRGKDAFVSFHEVLKAKDPDFHAFCALSKIPRDRIREIIDARTVKKESNPELNEADLNNILSSLSRGVSGLSNYLDLDLVMHEDKIIVAYKSAAEDHIDDFAHYFRTLYNILRFVDESKLIDEGEKIRYAKFIRSQLSEAELIVIFYNSVSAIRLPGRESLELGFPKMANLLVKYNILHNMNPRSIIHPSHDLIFSKNSPGRKP